MFIFNYITRGCMKNTKFTYRLCFSSYRNYNQDLYDEILTGDSDYQEISDLYLKNNEKTLSCYVVQPYIKWGPQKLRDITVNEQIDEAKALVHTLPYSQIEGILHVPLENFDKKYLFGKGTLEKLCNTFHKNPNVNLIYINLSNLKNYQLINLEKMFRVPIWDRYRIVMQILKEHAITKHSKLQVALAELYYLQNSIINNMLVRKFDQEKIRLMFQNRELKIKKAIKDLRMQRSLLRTKRIRNEYPVVAVVGYTNSGKTSLIKTLTNEEQLNPKDQLFATLDVTLHSGCLPSGLEVLYVDTVGFISDIPTNLIECFVATLEDAVLADLILHVEDISNSSYEFKRKHVLKTLHNLASKTGSEEISRKIISVGNKCDLVSSIQDFGILKVSAKEDIAIDILRLKLEESIIKVTNRQRIHVRVPNGGDEIRWLYKNSTVVSEEPDERDSQNIIAEIIISEGKLKQFKHNIKNL